MCVIKLFFWCCFSSHWPSIKSCYGTSVNQGCNRWLFQHKFVDVKKKLQNRRWNVVSVNCWHADLYLHYVLSAHFACYSKPAKKQDWSSFPFKKKSILSLGTNKNAGKNTGCKLCEAHLTFPGSSQDPKQQRPGLTHSGWEIKTTLRTDTFNTWYWYIF